MRNLGKLTFNPLSVNRDYLENLYFLTNELLAITLKKIRNCYSQAANGLRKHGECLTAITFCYHCESLWTRSLAATGIKQKVDRKLQEKSLENWETFSNLTSVEVERREKVEKILSDRKWQPNYLQIIRH